MRAIRVAQLLDVLPQTRILSRHVQHGGVGMLRILPLADVKLGSPEHLSGKDSLRLRFLKPNPFPHAIVSQGRLEGGRGVEVAYPVRPDASGGRISHVIWRKTNEGPASVHLELAPSSARRSELRISWTKLGDSLRHAGFRISAFENHPAGGTVVTLARGSEVIGHFTIGRAGPQTNRAAVYALQVQDGPHVAPLVAAIFDSDVQESPSRLLSSGSSRLGLPGPVWSRVKALPSARYTAAEERR